MDDFDRLQKLLDTLSDEPGAILARGPDTWIAIPPGPIGYVLVIGPAGVPIWEDPANVPFSGS